MRTAALAPGVGRGRPAQVVVPSGDVLFVGGSTATQVVRGCRGHRAAEVVGLRDPALVSPWAFWMITPVPPVELVERAPDGQAGRRLALSQDPGVIVLAGSGFLVSPGGRVTALDADTGGEEELVDGIALAYDGRTLVRSTCGGAPDCGLVLIDVARGSGARWPG